MVWLYLCKSCENGDHGHCELSHPAPKGHYGGSLCRCPCCGNSHWDTPEFIEEELRGMLDKVCVHQQASEEAVKDNPMIIEGGKIKLKQTP